MHVQYYEKACYDAWRRMRDVDVIPYGYEALEFLAVGVTPSWKVKPIESPRRYIGGKSHAVLLPMAHC